MECNAGPLPVARSLPHFLLSIPLLVRSLLPLLLILGLLQKVLQGLQHHAGVGALAGSGDLAGPHCRPVGCGNHLRRGLCR